MTEIKTYSSFVSISDYSLIGLHVVVYWRSLKTKSDLNIFVVTDCQDGGLLPVKFWSCESGQQDALVAVVALSCEL